MEESSLHSPSSSTTMSSSSSGSMIPWDVNSYDGKLMFAAIISLLLVLSFVLLLHAYARWVFLLDQSSLQRRRTTLSSRAGSTSTTTRLRHHLRIVDESGVEFENDDDKMGGVDDNVIASIPVFVHKMDDDGISRLECVICLGVFEDGEIGRHLPNCNHVFHVKCIDRWLGSHSSCPICRALVEWKKPMDVKSVVLRDETEEVLDEVVVADQEYSQPPTLTLPSPPPPSPVQLQFLMGCSLKRILSLSRSEIFFPSSSSSSSNVNDLNV